MKRLLILFAWAAVGCGGNPGPPPQSTDPAALEREATQGKELRGQLER